MFNFYSFNIWKSFCTGCLHNFLFVFGFQKFEYDTPLVWGFSWEDSIYSAWWSLSVLELLFDSCYSFKKTLMYYSSSSFLPGLIITHRSDLLVLSPISWMFCCIFSFTSILSHCSVINDRAFINPVSIFVRVWLKIFWCSCLFTSPNPSGFVLLKYYFLVF